TLDGYRIPSRESRRPPEPGYGPPRPHRPLADRGARPSRRMGTSVRGLNRRPHWPPYPGTSPPPARSDYRITAGAAPEIPRFLAVICAGMRALANATGPARIVTPQGFRCTAGVCPLGLDTLGVAGSSPASPIPLIRCHALSAVPYPCQN